MNNLQKPITPTKEESEWIDNHRHKHATMLWRYAAMANTLDISWLDGCIDPEATYSSQSVIEELVGENKIRDYLTDKLKIIQVSGSEILVRAGFAELSGTGNNDGSACVAIYQAQSEFDQSAWNTPECCMDLQVLKGKITRFFMVTAIPSPAEAKVSNLFPLASALPKPSPIHINSASYPELCFSLFLLDGQTPFDEVAREQVDIVMQQYSGASYREITTIPGSPESDFETNELSFVGFPSLAVSLRGKVLYKHTGLIFSDRLTRELKECFL